MRILIFGAGVLGSLYAGRLVAAGQDGALLARGTRLQQLRRDGLVLLDEATGQKTHPQVRVVEQLGAEDTYDLIMVIIRAEQLADALPMLATNKRVPCILFLHNRASGPGALFDALGPGRVLLGFPGAGGAREPTQVRYRLIPQQPTTLGEPDGRITPRLGQVAEALLQAGFPVAFSRNMDAWLKTHAVFVTAIAGAIYDAGGTCAALTTRPDGVHRLVRAVRQGFLALLALGVPIQPRKLAVLFLWLPLIFPVAYWKRYFARPDAELIFARHARAGPGEMLELVNELRTLIGQAHAATPDLDSMWSAVQAAATNWTSEEMILHP
jgi:2-dehydropantoate 2-reductase